MDTLTTAACRVRGNPARLHLDMRRTGQGMLICLMPPWPTTAVWHERRMERGGAKGNLEYYDEQTWKKLAPKLVEQGGRAELGLFKNIGVCVSMCLEKRRGVMRQARRSMWIWCAPTRAARRTLR